ncbi:MAG: hypothetical protein JW776_09500, partial [Candidatus Lokiarchaeota archaeon]|nr:hypothetical protein [Candidatus Lokiarchaeota archaeon]
EASRNQLLSIGWKKEADKLLSAINMYENFYQKDVLDRKKLQLIEKMDEQEKKRLQETIRLQKEEDELKEMERLKKLTEIEKKKALEEEISKQVFKQIEEIEKEVKEYNEHPINEKITSASPYLRAKNIYQSARDELLKIGWKIEADKLLTPISMYENLHHKDQMEREKLHLIKKKQMEEQKKLEESIRSQTEEVERREQEKRQKLEEISKKKEQEDQISKVTFQAIEDIEKEVKFYKEHALAEHYALDCPYLRAKNVYEASRNQLLSIGWKKEADKLLSAINMYEKLLYTDEIERGKFLEKQEKEKEEKRKLYESIQIQKEERERQERERIRALREQELQKQHETDVSEKAFQLIEDIEKDVTHYRERVKIENYHLPCPYDRAIEVYKTAQKMLMEIGWKKEADKLTNSIRVYDRLSNEDLEIRNKFKAKLEKEKEAERELQETIQREKERLLLEEEKRKSELEKFDKKKRETEQLQQSAYEKLEAGNRYIQEKEFDKASEELQEALKLFKKIKWKSGIKLTENAIKYKENEQEKFERLLQHERLALQEKVKKEQEFQEFLEEQRRIKDQEEQNRKLELLRIEMASKKVSEQQESAFNKLEEGNDLVKIREFDKANKLYLEALSIFQDIGWVDGVEKTKQSISHNLIEQERYKQHLEFQKKQEQERQKEEQELNELIRKRQELTQLEEQKKRLQIEQQHEQAEKIKQRQQEALELLEQGNEKTTQNLFDEAEKDFNHAMTIFQEIKWSHGIKITEEVLKHNAEERSRFLQLQKRDEKARLEQIKQQKELEQMLAKQKLTAQQEARLKELQQAQETEKKFQIQSMQEEAMLYLEKGNEAIQIKKFNQANALFASAMKIFQEMGWQKGIEMTNSALDYNQKELLKFENERLREEQKKQEALRRQEEINQLIKESKAEEIQKQLEWKKKLEEKTQRIDEENSIKDQIFALLERGSKLAAKNEFLSAIELYKKTIPLFEKISWPLKRDQVIDLIDSTQQDYDNYRKHLAKEEAIRKKQAEEEEQMRLLIQSEQEKEKARQKLIQQQQFEQQERDKRNEELRKEAAEEINKASVMLERRKFENAIESLNIALSNFKKLGWDKEAKVTEERIAEVNKQRRETYKPIDREESASDMEISEQGYGQIEEADKFIRQKKYRKALPYLEEAARLFEKIQWTKAIKMVERRIRETEKLITEKEELIEKLRSRRSRKTEKEAYQLLEKVDKFRRENHYDYALTSAKEAQRIFQDLKWEKEAAELDKLIHTIEKENEEQKVVRTQEQSERMEKIKVEEEEERKIQEIIEERRRRRRETRQKLKDE